MVPPKNFTMSCLTKETAEVQWAHLTLCKVRIWHPFHLLCSPWLLSNNHALPVGMKTNATKCYCPEHGIFFFLPTIKMYTSKCLYLLLQESILPTGQASIVVNLTGGEESGTVCHMRVQLGLRLGITLPTKT